MELYVVPIKNLLIDFLNAVAGLINTQPRVAFIGYKDKKDENQIMSKGFTTKYEEMVDFIKGIKYEGGGDTCEDIVTALREALKLDWSSDLNYVYLITDSPTHGKRYHDDNCSDDYPDDDKDKLLEKLASHYRKSKINLSILRCNNSVDKMIGIIKENYDSPRSELKVIDINSKDCFKKDFTKNFYRSLTNSIEESLVNSRVRNFRKISKKALEPEEILPKYEMEFESSFRGKVNTGSVTGLAFDKKKYGYSIQLKSSAEVECKISGSMISSGVFINCYALHVDGNTNYVAKLPKKVAAKAEDLFPDIEGTLLTKALADKFNFLLKQAEKKDKGNQMKYFSIRVLSLSIMENLDYKKSKRPRFFLAQQFLNGEYVKFNNNYGWKNKDNDSYNLIAQAFSHFTYEYTMGVIMITDIQGIRSGTDELSITDPAIHSFLYNQQFGETNHGKLGMIRFFTTHECNDYCKKLHLIHPKLIDHAAVQSMKEKRKGEEPLDHLYEKFEPDIKKWREQIQSFDPNLDLESDAIEEEPNKDDVNTTYSVKYVIKPK